MIDPPAGVALGSDVACEGACQRNGSFTISVNPVLLTSQSAVGRVRIISPNAPQAEIVVTVSVDADFELGAPGTSRAY